MTGLNNKVRDIQELIKEFCSIILTTDDKLNIEKGKQYASSLLNEEISILNGANTEQCEALVQKQVFDYVRSFKSATSSSPFEFDTKAGVNEFKASFVKAYKEKNNKNDIPIVLDNAFKYIDEISEHYRIFENFLFIRSQKIIDTTLEQTTSIAKQKADEAVKMQISSTIVETAKNEVSKVVENKMIEITKSTSETSVTILGIFATIVLTVVAGLIYSSSVLSSVASSDFYRLISIASLVGLVCFNLLSSMYVFVERIKNSGKKTTYFNFFVVFVNIILLGVFITFTVLENKCA